MKYKKNLQRTVSCLSLFFAFSLSQAQETHNIVLSMDLKQCETLDVSTFTIIENPVEQLLKIRSTEENFFLRLYTAGGKMILSNNYSENTAAVDCSSLSSGIYIVVLSTLAIRESYEIMIR